MKTKSQERKVLENDREGKLKKENQHVEFSDEKQKRKTIDRRKKRIPEMNYEHLVPFELKVILFERLSSESSQFINGAPVFHIDFDCGSGEIH